MKGHGITVAVRCAGERTEAVCRALVESQLGRDCVVVVREVPFHAAVQRCLELGIERHARWLVCVDGDVLARKGAITGLLGAMGKAPANTFMLQARIIDKLWGGPKDGGIRVYRGELLGEAQRSLPCEGAPTLRPEATMIAAMRKKGYGYVQLPSISGLHDYEQYYRDLYRKVRGHLQKHGDYVNLLLPYWRREAHSDPDFAVTLEAATESSPTVYGEFLRVEPNSKPHAQMPWMLHNGSEKGALSDRAVDMAWIEKTIADHQVPPEYADCERLAGQRKRWDQVPYPLRIAHELWNRLFRQLQSRGRVR
jgi:hypothetical protein